MKLLEKLPRYIMSILATSPATSSTSLFSNTLGRDLEDMSSPDEVPDVGS